MILEKLKNEENRLFELVYLRIYGKNFIDVF